MTKRWLPEDLEPPLAAVREAVTAAIKEDLLPIGDLSAGLLPASAYGRAAFVARAAGVVAGTRCAEEAFAQIDPSLQVRWLVADGGEVAPGGVIGRVNGPLRSLLTAERTALNFLCHLSGIATATQRYVEAAGQANGSVRVVRPHPACGRSRRPPSGPGARTTTGAAFPKGC